MTTRLPHKLISLLLLLCPFIAMAQDWKQYVPTVSGSIRAKYEYQPQESNSRFQVRSVRVALSGSVLPILSYRAEVDFCDEGKIKLLDAYGKFTLPKIDLNFTLGQMRVPFTIDAHRGPTSQFFVNRSFLAKQVGNVRDVGLMVMYGFGKKTPVTLEAGIFNGSGLTEQKDFWTKSYNFSFKATAQVADCLFLEASCQKTRPDVSIMMWDAGLYYFDKFWHIEAEYLRKNYRHNAFPGVNSVDAFVSRLFPINNRILNGISALARYDYMSDHSAGVRNEDGVLTVDDSQRNRITAGTTLHFGYKKVFAELKLNYEKYFYPKDAVVGVSDHDKLSLELMLAF